MALLAARESKLLIDGKLVAGSAGVFPTINPATEDTLGVAADATTADMGTAIEAARRIQAQGSRSARWIAADALRELNSDAVQARLAARR